ncbi:ribosome maturation factor RimP [Ornithinimicrobium tianjinense]|uniref:Ribosome maturation factor RimP n=1 Tax=Ornithinimicrobium tianjinense TaxID=1195761 RepID=A0A917BND7_9MICO|nr:ribosome maturation factor RimP [Ornithinimicrobium tianjinense]GGF49835.1 ribosome maturation factor RimP [Ornithinimicrobium tianjinense]
MDTRERAAQVTTEVSRTLAGTGVVVDDVSVQQAGRRRLVRVFLARDLSGLAEGDDTSTVEPLTLDEVADATRAVSAALDASDAMGESAYTLEVSSPGLDRPLTTRDHFRRNVGRLVAVALTDGGTLDGRLVAVGADGIRLTDNTERQLAWEEVAKATVQVEFARAEKKDH